MGRTVLASLAALMLAFSAGVAFGRLPPPTPEEAAKKKAAAEKKATDDEVAKKALERAQDRVAARYKARHRR
jgi:hypothetical protein